MNIPLTEEQKTAWRKFTVWLIRDTKWGLARFARTKQEKAALEGIAKVFSTNKLNAPAWQKAKVEAFRVSINSPYQSSKDALDAALSAADYEVSDTGEYAMLTIASAPAAVKREYLLAMLAKGTEVLDS